MISPSQLSDKADPIDTSDTTRFAFVRSLLTYTSLSKLLRLIGAATLIIAIYIFLFQGWSSGNDIERYLIMLAQTLLLALIGFVCSRWLNENKSARLLLGLALFSVPVNFAILAAMLYSQVQWDVGINNYPDFASWSSDSLISALVTMSIGWLLLTPVIFIGFMVLARKSAIRLSLIFMLSNAAILLPIRNAETISIFLILLTVIILQQLSVKFSKDISLRTLEGRFARTILFLPIIIIVGRTFYLYAPDILMFTVIAGLSYVIFRQLAMDKGFSLKFCVAMECLGVLSAGCIAMGLTLLINSQHIISDMGLVLLLTLCFAALVIEISLRASAGGAGYRRLAVITIVIGMLSNLFLLPSVVTAGISLATGIIMLIYGYSTQQRITFILGLFTILIGLSYQVSYVMTVFNLGSWISLSLLGVSAIFIASVLERHGLAIRTRMVNWQHDFKSWEY